MTDLAKLTVKLEAESSKLHRELGKANKKLSRFERDTNKSIASINKSFKSIGTGLAAALSVTALTMFAKASLNAADSVQKMSIRLGASTEALSEYKHVADLSGVSFQTFTMGLQRMTRRVAEAAQGTGEAKNALAELGLSAKYLADLKPEQQFEILADAFSNVGSESDRVRLAMKLFDSEGVALLQTMQNGSAGIREMRQEASDLGLTLDQETADAAARANDSMTRLAAGANALGIQMIRVLGPSIEAIMGWLQKSLPQAAQFTLDAFTELQRATLNLGHWFTGALANAEADLANIADLAGADTLAKAFMDAAYEYAKMATTFESASLRIGTVTTNQRELNKELIAGKSYSDIYNESIKNQALAEASLKTSKQGLTEEQKTYNKLLSEASSLTESLRTPMEVYQANIERLNLLREQAGLSQESYNRALVEYQRQLDDAMGKEKEKADETKSLFEQMKEATADWGRNFADAMLQGEFSFSSFVDNMINELARIAIANATQPLFNAFAAGIGDIFGGFFADGGEPPMGKISVVGENGPELFVPKSPGTIIPNESLGGRGKTEITVNVNAQGAITQGELIQRAAALGAQRGLMAVQSDIEQGGITARLVGRKM
jgi:hypothetical protein